jgi:hypothetical protein
MSFTHPHQPGPGKSYLAKLRTDPQLASPPTKQARIYAFDPDLRHCGWAVLDVKITGRRVQPVTWNAGLLVATGYKSLQQVDQMVKVISAWQPTRVNFFQGNFSVQGIVEAQEIYRGSPADANDLLRLAQVSGALQCRLWELQIGNISVLPKVWKGNKGKEGMHERLGTWLDTCEVKRGLDSLTFAFGANAEHALDAVCLAKWLAYEIAEGRR